MEPRERDATSGKWGRTSAGSGHGPMVRRGKAGNRMRDLTAARAIWTKGVPFLLLGVGSAVLLFLEAPSLRAAVLLAVGIWGFCRAYYLRLLRQ